VWWGVVVCFFWRQVEIIHVTFEHVKKKFQVWVCQAARRAQARIIRRATSLLRNVLVSKDKIVVVVCGARKMDDHFAAVLGTAKSVATSFIPSSTFVGAKTGYIFTTAEFGPGYYVDNKGAKRGRDEDVSGSSRAKRAALEAAEAAVSGGGRGGSSVLDGAALLEAAEKAAAASGDVPSGVVDFDLDLPGLKILVLGFEKKINKNQRLRVKHADEPEKVFHRHSSDTEHPLLTKLLSSCSRSSLSPSSSLMKKSRNYLLSQQVRSCTQASWNLAV
jgi:hypothetical protein